MRTSASASPAGLRYSRVAGRPPIFTSPLGWKPWLLAVSSASRPRPSGRAPFLGGEIGDVDSDRVVDVPGGRSGFSGIERDLRDNVPLVVAGSNGAPEASRSRSSGSSSAAARPGPRPEAHPRRRFVRCVSGTSNRPLVIVSLRPDGRSTVPLAERPSRCGRDAHVEIGIAQRRQAIDRTDAVAAGDELDRQPVVRQRRPARLEASTAAHWSRSATRSTVPPTRRSTTQARSRGVTSAGHSRLNADTVIRVPAIAERKARIGAGKIDRAGDRDAARHAAEVGLLDLEPLPDRIDPHAHRDAVDDQWRIARAAARGEHRSPPGC